MRGKPFELGNTMGKGRPRGSRNKRTIYQEALESHALPIIFKMKFEALKEIPDMTALCTCFERLVPIPKPANSRFRLPRVQTPADLPNMLSAVERAVCSGQASAQEGLAMAQITELHRRAFEIVDIDRRIRALEQERQAIPLLPIDPILEEPVELIDSIPDKPVEPIDPIPDKPVEAIDPNPEKEGEDS